MKKFGIDISRWQGNFDVAKAKEKEGVEFAIIKIGGGDGGLYEDAQFKNNYSKCEQAGLDKGCYFFGRAMTIAEAEKEANYMIKLLKGRKFEYPVYYDVEGDMLRVNKEDLTKIVLTFCDKVEKAGYYVGVYTSESHFNANLDDSKLSKFTHWVAKYSTEAPKIKNNVDIWQFGGGVNFIRDTKICGQTVDQDYCYVDFPAKIKKLNLNGYGNKVETPVTPTPSPSENVTTKYREGDIVEYNGIYTSSTSADKLNPSVTKGTITKVLPGTPNPYLINNGTGWTNDGCIVNNKVEDTKVENNNTNAKPNVIPKGTLINIKSGAKDLNANVAFADIVYKTQYKVISSTETYVVFGYDDQRITGKVSVSDVIVNSATSAPVEPPVAQAPSIKVGSKVSVINPVIYGTNNTFNTWGRQSFDVIDINGDRVVIGVNGVVTSAISINNIKLV